MSWNEGRKDELKNDMNGQENMPEFNENSYSNNENSMYQNGASSSYENQWNVRNAGNLNDMGQNFQYNPNMYQTYYKNSESSAYGISALCVSIVSLLLSVCFGGYLGIISLIFGIISIKKNERLKALGITGIVLSAIAIVVSFAMTILLIIGMHVKEEGYEEYRHYYDMWNECSVMQWEELEEACVLSVMQVNLNKEI